MSARIVQSSGPVTLVGGGEIGPSDLDDALALAPTCVAADGGLGPVLRAGVQPAAVIGDFDSVAEDDLRRVPAALRHRVTEQDSTDFEKALGAIDAPVVLAVGFLGARVDHQLAAMHTLIAVSSPPSLLLGASEVIFHVPPALDIPCAAGEVVSLFPLGPVTGRSQGLEWPIDGLDFAPGHLIGTSNRALEPVQLWMDGPGMIGIVPRRHLAALTQALAAAPRFSPRHAPSDAL